MIKKLLILAIVFMAACSNKKQNGTQVPPEQKPNRPITQPVRNCEEQRLLQSIHKDYTPIYSKIDFNHLNLDQKIVLNSGLFYEFLKRERYFVSAEVGEQEFLLWAHVRLFDANENIYAPQVDEECNN